MILEKIDEYLFYEKQARGKSKDPQERYDEGILRPEYLKGNA